MIALDSSSLIAYLQGDAGPDVEAIEECLDQQHAALPPVVLVELLSDPKLPKTVAAILRKLPLLTLAEGHWDRAGLLRAKVLSRGLKARLADTLIAQCCIDNELPLITRDGDYRHFAKHGGLKLLALR